VLYLPRVFAGQADNIQRLMEGVDSSISFKEVMLRMGHIKPYDFIPQARGHLDWLALADAGCLGA
jgi:hypothetical protein